MCSGIPVKEKKGNVNVPEEIIRKQQKKVELMQGSN
jgi:hypothetical protein